MEKLELIGGILLLATSLFAVLFCLMQDQKAESGMTGAITGASSDSFYGKNAGRTKEAILCKITGILTAVFFVVTLLVNILPVYITT